MDTTTETVRIPFADDVIWGDLYLPEPVEAKRVVVLCHGFKGYRRWGFIPDVAEALRASGAAALAIDFSLNGTPYAAGATDNQSEPVAYVDPDRFARNTIARECAELGQVIDWIGDNKLDGVAAGAAIGLWGHSRGGMSVLLNALADKPIRSVVTWSATAHPNFYTDRQKQRWRNEGGYRFTDRRLGIDLALGIDYLHDLEANDDNYNMAERAGELTVPHLIVHGQSDLVIPVADAERLYMTPTLKADKKFLRLFTGHTFGIEGQDPEPLRNAIRGTVEWFDEYLGEKQ